MKIHRFIIEDSAARKDVIFLRANDADNIGFPKKSSITHFDGHEKNIRMYEKEVVNQMRNVLKLKEGEKVILADGKLNEMLGSIGILGKDFIEVKVEKFYKNENEVWANVVLYCSVLKKENFELVVQKATEVGVKEIMPIISKRTVKLHFKKSRLEKIIKEAAEQSGRGMIPILHDAADFNTAIKRAGVNDVNLFFDARGKNVKDFLHKGKQRIGIFIGPEGGFDEEELRLAAENGFKIVSLGKLTLRGETAAIVASYLALG